MNITRCLYQYEVWNIVENASKNNEMDRFAEISSPSRTQLLICARFPSKTIGFQDTFQRTFCTGTCMCQQSVSLFIIVLPIQTSLFSGRSTYLPGRGLDDFTHVIFQPVVKIATYSYVCNSWNLIDRQIESPNYWTSRNIVDGRRRRSHD